MEYKNITINIFIEEDDDILAMITDSKNIYEFAGPACIKFLALKEKLRKVFGEDHVSSEPPTCEVA